MDRASIGKLTLLAGAWIGSLFGPEESAACCFSNLFRRNTTPVTAYYGATAPVAAPAAPAGGCCGPGTCEQTVLRYVPEVAYRTVWQPVPVTTYRRTVSSNPTTGLPITCTQPCTSYTYQARRVPYTTFRPVYTTEPVTPAVPTAPVASLGYAAPASYAAPATTGCTGCSAAATSWTPTPSTSAQPYYSTPESTTPSAGATPWEPVQPTPSAVPADGGNQPRANGDPANQPPRIPPSIDPEVNATSSLRTIPSIQRQYAVDSSGSTSRGDRGSAPAATSPSTTPWNTIRPTYDEPPAAEDRWSQSTSTGQEYAEPPPRSTLPNYHLRPLPNLDSPPPASNPVDSTAPPLLNDPRDRTAVTIQPIPTRWASTRIAWPERQASYQTEVKSERDQAPAVRSLDAPRRLDPHRIQLQRFDSDSNPPEALPREEGGWRSARR